MKAIKYIVVITLIALTIFVISMWDRIPEIRYLYYSFIYSLYKNDGTCPGCQVNFTDNVYQHKKAYKSEGIKPQLNSKNLDRLYRKRVLKKIESNDLYLVRRLSYSDPYLLPKANEFILNICRKYNDSCLRNNLDYIPLTITSLTRTKESVNRLTKNNQNAIEESAHLKGKTFDISYKAFGSNKKQFGLFAGILNEERKKELCFVKYESNGCLHITVN